MVSPFRITAWSKSFDRLGIIGAPVSVTVNPRHNQQPTGSITVPSNLPAASALLGDGVRITVDYAGQQILSGPVRVRTGTSDPGGTLTVRVDDDWRLLTRMLAWPNPTGAITAQGADDITFDKKTGPAETVVKWFVSRNATRLGLPVTVATDLGRGDTITVQMRMQPLVDGLLPLIDLAGIGVTVRQVGAGLVVDCYEPAQYPRVLTPRSGVVQDWEWEQAAPKYTRVVVGGGGVTFNRDFRQYVSTALESTWGDKVEVFLDANDAFSDAKTAYDKWYDARADAADKQKKHDQLARDLTAANRRSDQAATALHVADFIKAQNPGNTTASANADEALSRYTDAVNDQVSISSDESSAMADLVAANALQASTLTAYNTARIAYLAELDTRGAATLAEGAPTAGLTLKLAETDTFRYGEHLKVGDLVTTELIPGAGQITDVLREAELNWNAQDGFTATPVVGERNDDPNRVFVKAIARVMRAIRNDRAGR